MGQPVGDEVFDGDDAQAQALGHLQQFWQAGHRAVGIHDLHDDASGFKPGETRQIDGSFGMSRPTENATAARPQGEDVAGSAQFFRAGGWVDQRLDGFGAVHGADAGCAAMADQIDAHGERRFEGRVVPVDHQLQIELVAPVLDEGGAN